MQYNYEFLLALGGILLLGMATDMLGHRTSLPRVTLLLFFGVLIGPFSLDLIPDIFRERFDLITQIALLMIGFLLGGKLTYDTFKKNGKLIISISVIAAITTTIVVFIGLYAAGTVTEIAIILACISSATAPAATMDIVIESGRNNRFSNVLLTVVALDDVWGLILFSLGIAIVTAINGTDNAISPLLFTIKDIGGAILLGAAIGLPAAYLTGRIKAGQPILTEALGLVFLCGGLAEWLGVSFLIASIVMGAVIANLAKHHDYPFHAIEGIEWPMLVIFFVLAGASLEISALTDIGIIGGIYIVCRTFGKIFGAWLGGVTGQADKVTKRWMGLAMLPQAGAAMGMALVASYHFPEYRQLLLTIVISSTILFELFGPVFTRIALKHSTNT